MSRDRLRALERFKGGTQGRPRGPAQKPRHKGFNNGARGGLVGHAAPYAVSSVFKTPQADQKIQKASVNRSEVMNFSPVNYKDFKRFDSTEDTTGLVVNPGNPMMTTWLQKMARLYEQYEFHSVAFEYVPTCATNTEGRYVMAWDPDPADAPPTTLVEALQIGGATAFSPWEHATLTIPRQYLGSKFTNAKYTSSSPDEVDFNHALGKFYFLSDGGTIPNVDPGPATGFVKIQYHVSLVMPQLHEGIGDGYYATHTTGASAIKADAWLKSTRSWNLNNNLVDRGWTFGPNATFTGLKVDVPAGATGHYMFILCQTSTTGSTTAGTAPSVTGGVTLHKHFKTENGLLDSVKSAATVAEAAPQIIPHVFLADVWGSNAAGTVEFTDAPTADANICVTLTIIELPHLHIEQKLTAAGAAGIVPADYLARLPAREQKGIEEYYRARWSTELKVEVPDENNTDDEIEVMQDLTPTAALSCGAPAIEQDKALWDMRDRRAARLTRAETKGLR